MTRWMIETHKEAPAETDGYVQGLEELLNTHLELLDVVNTTRDLHWFDLCTGLLTGVTFIQTLLVEETDPVKRNPALREALLNLANIALTFNRRIPEYGTPETEGMAADTRPELEPVQSDSRSETKIQGHGEKLPEPPHDQCSGLFGCTCSACLDGIH